MHSFWYIYQGPKRNLCLDKCKCLRKSNNLVLALVQSRALVLSREAWLHLRQAGKQGEWSVSVLELGGWPMWRGRG